MQAGSLVECVDDRNQREELHFPNGKLVRKEIYTVTGFTRTGGVLLDEKPCEHYLGGSNMVTVGHRQSRFREVQPPMDLTELLNETIWAQK